MIYLMRTKERIEKSAARHKMQSAMAKNLLLYGLQREYRMSEMPLVERKNYGKPYFPEYPEIHFNYSHADVGILCGIAETEIGVDIERLISGNERMIRALCHENEKKLLCKTEDPILQSRMLSRIWTAKESYLKCIGTGIRQKLSGLDLSKSLRGEIFAEEYHFFFLDGEDFQAAVCLKTKDLSPSVFVCNVKEENIIQMRH